MKKLFWMWITAGVVAGITLWPLRASAESGYPSTPRAVLEKFLQLDADAAGISSETWPEIARYSTWPGWPAWENFVVIDHYTIGKVMQGSTRAQINVAYQTLGQLSDKFVEDVKTENVAYHLNKVQGQWRVDGPQLPPHVSFDVMKRRLAAAPNAKASNDALIQQIETARQHVR